MIDGLRSESESLRKEEIKTDQTKESMNNWEETMGKTKEEFKMKVQTTSATEVKGIFCFMLTKQQQHLSVMVNIFACGSGS